jgi:hypothetical protein
VILGLWFFFLYISIDPGVWWIFLFLIVCVLRGSAFERGVAGCFCFPVYGWIIHQG